MINLLILAANGLKFPKAFKTNLLGKGVPTVFEASHLKPALEDFVDRFQHMEHAIDGRPPETPSQLHSNDAWWFLIRSHGLSWIAEFLGLTASLQSHSSDFVPTPYIFAKGSKLFGTAQQDAALYSISSSKVESNMNAKSISRKSTSASKKLL